LEDLIEQDLLNLIINQGNIKFELWDHDLFLGWDSLSQLFRSNPKNNNLGFSFLPWYQCR
jgi:hypothetical protein